jgi:DNA-binding MarR family transcriptional regulator
MATADECQRIANDMRQECLATCVRQINRRVTRIYDAALRPHGIGTAQLNILVALAIAGAGGARQARIAKALGLEKSTLSRNLGRIIERGWVRTEPDPDGGERLVLTAEGRRVMMRALPAWSAAQRRASAEVHGQLVEALTRSARASDPRSSR